MLMNHKKNMTNSVTNPMVGYIFLGTIQYLPVTEPQYLNPESPFGVLKVSLCQSLLKTSSPDVFDIMIEILFPSQSFVRL